jgi:hypothetical protein
VIGAVEVISVFAEYEIPVAYSMVAMATQVPSVHPLQAFTCYWAAFNNIYVAISERAGKSAQLRKNADGSLRTRAVGQINIPRVSTVSEREQIDLAFQRFPDELKRRIVEHSSTRFFAYRTPHWRGQPIEKDASGQRLNGVLNVGHTVDAKHPVWAPIDIGMFEAYQSGARNSVHRDALASQILDLLYTVRNNAFHGGKSADDANDTAVLEQALPLLVMIVASFVRIREAA